MSIVRVGVLLLLFLILGCETIGTTAATNDAAIAKIKVGASGKGEVRRLLGEPSTAYTNLLIRGNTVDVWAYRYSHRREDPLTVVPILNFYSTRAARTESSVNIFFDPFGIVRDIQIARHK